VDVYWDRLGREGGREAAYAMLLQMNKLDRLREQVERIEAPTRVVWGDRDALMDVGTGERLVELLGDARLEVVEGCGHAVAEERPDALIDLLLEYLG